MPAYLGLRRAAHRAEAAAGALAVADSDDDADDDAAPPPPPPRQQLASEMTSLESDVAGSGVGQSGADFDSYIPSPESELPPDAAASVADAPAAAPARITHSGTAGEPHANVLASHRAAQAPIAISDAIEATDVGHTGAGFGGYIPSLALEPPPGAAESVADAAAAAVPATAPARVPRADTEREQHKSALTSYHSGNAVPRNPSQRRRVFLRCRDREPTRQLPGALRGGGCPRHRPWMRFTICIRIIKTRRPNEALRSRH